MKQETTMLRQIWAKAIELGFQFNETDAAEMLDCIKQYKEYRKLTVCASCCSPDIIDKDCRCVYDRNYPTVDLEFQSCPCCNGVGALPATTEFNDKTFNNT